MRRRELLKAGGGLLAGALLQPRWLLAADVLEIELLSDPAGGHVNFDPIGLFLQPGQTVRWVNRANVHTVTAYHPDNDRHPLRIPRAAEPWDSGYLIEPGKVFERRFEVPGVYDYYCAPHEAAGMVGRLVVGEISGPGSRPFDYFRGDPGAADWRTVPAAARARFPDARRILREGRYSI
ncbi:plastocyanin/azurin family copper-binding protein [Alkalilimnicola sp. S0819]|uniref:plastocyanin/azurin family copper-binding protein n=1 Tax=Alkalilimnicola sp. S0819 TaxID=2613922 RepID=UPI001261F11C|nr:plastocyanin/azurin family copper-binding protein [Alkalilimnicola sp. S0819]KAB7624199.1 hypothetical protein F3N43_07365 [Alkalilimnicola sp. S0819]MPQ16454.1 hypothetical protein [Alkalilimnicola sp. S0819]